MSFVRLYVEKTDPKDASEWGQKQQIVTRYPKLLEIAAKFRLDERFKLYKLYLSIGNPKLHFPEIQWNKKIALSVRKLALDNTEKMMGEKKVLSMSLYWHFQKS